MAKIGIVTVLYNSSSVLEDFFKTLSQQTLKDFVLYIIDNKSPDDSLSKSKELAIAYQESFLSVIIENDDNYGIAAGNNIGVKRALEDNCDYILLSNNDIVMNNDCISLLLSKIQETNIDMIVPKIFFYDEPLIWMAGGYFTKFSGGTRHIGSMKKDRPEYNKYRLISYAPTCVMLIKKDAFDKVGFFEEKFFVYFDDTDWVYRSRKRGLKLAYHPEAVVYHKESTSTGGQQSDFTIYYQLRNHFFFCKKNFFRFHYWLFVMAKCAHHFLYYRWTLNEHQRGVADKAIYDGLKMN